MKFFWMVLLGIGCSQAALGDQSIEVLSMDGNPVSGATVLIGSAPGDPFEGNQFVTNSEGVAALPTQWKTSLPITISADGFVTMTQLEALPVARTFRLSLAELPEALELGGMTDGFGRLRRDGKLDVGVVMPTFSRQDLLSFDISSVISPQTDTISVVGQRFDVPSNITFPKQRERYIIGFTINKPQYRTYSRKTGPQQFVASHAQFPVKRVIDKVRRGDSILTAINDFTFKGGGIIDVDLQSEKTSENIMVDQLSYDQTLKIKGAQFPQEQMMLSIAASESEGQLFPTDLKFVEQGQEIDLTTFDNGNPRWIASMLTNRPENDVINIEGLDRTKAWSLTTTLMNLIENTPEQEAPSMGQMSLVIQSESEQGQVPQFLSLVEEPQVSGGQLIVSPPTASGDVIPARTILVYSAIQEVESGALKIEQRTRLWQLSQPGWINTIDLPEVQLDSSVNSTHHRWEVIYLGVKRSNLLSEGLDEITHITRNFVDVQ